MGFKNFRAAVVLRLLLFSGLVIVAIWGYLVTEWQVTPLLSAVLAAFVLIETLRYVESVNRELSTFLEFVAHDDFSSSVTTGEKGRVFRRLEDAYKLLADKYRDLNQARELNHLYLEALVEHVSIAILCLDDANQVTLMNREAKRLFRTPMLGTLASLKLIDSRLPAQLEALENGERALIRLRIDDAPVQLVSYVTEFQLLDRRHRLISFQDIRDELEQREVDFSQKLIKVLTHEIMNSVTPIIALCKVIEQSLSETVQAGTAFETRGCDSNDLLRSVASIQSRGDGLLRFVQAYSSLTSLPAPNRKAVDVGRLLNDTITLMSPTLEPGGPSLGTRLEAEGLSIEADPEQVQQVLINLVRNAAEALDGRDDGEIVLSAAREDHDRVVVRVTDNGPGIPEDRLEHIFVPFFTTKRRGTGVGLSVSRQIMFLNRGLISVRTATDRGAEFSLQFRPGHSGVDGGSRYPGSDPNPGAQSRSANPVIPRSRR
jgi:nitrogen fixation/metabolism regulation signal transduction histidine kinase